MQLNKVAGAALAALAVLGLAAGTPASAADVAKPATAAVDWALNATAIEACSCPMFCQCYFNTQPAAHHDHGGESKHYCRANLAYKVNKGHYGATSLDGAKFWLSNDLGADFSKGQMDWNVLTFDKSLSKEQRDGIGAIASVLFPVKWNSFTTAEGTIDKWEFTKDEAVALLDGGKTAEVRLKRPAASGMTAEPIVIKNLKYWGAPRNDGFVLMPNEVEAYRVGPNAFEYKGTNGFLITIDMTSKDFATAKP
jgi:opacity protein-like surface antigen